LKGVAVDTYGGHHVSAAENDFIALDEFKDFLDSLDDDAYGQGG
jgi:hypothetical protein